MDSLQTVATYLILFALPYFWTLIALEWLVSVIQKRRLFRLNDSIADVNMGMVDRVADMFVKTAVLGVYMLVYEHFHLMKIDTGSVAAWILCFVLVDFCFYWAHRMCHTLNFLWACHVVHHSSEEMNLTVALRQSATETMFTWVFYLSLAVAGFPWEMWFICFQINLLYQFWIHTRVVGKLGPLEWVMNTPSHHRVHHGADVKYIDKNHAGTFIVWDRLFGTFQEEEEEPIYGIVTPVKSWNPLWVHAHHWVRIASLAWRAPRFVDKIKVWFMLPAWLPEGVAIERSGPTVRDPGYRKFNPRIPGGLSAYAAVQFLFTLVLFTAFAAREEELSAAEKLIPAALVLSSLVCLGGIFERRPWALIAEPLRLGGIAASLAAAGGLFYGASFTEHSLGAAVVAGVTLGMAGWFLLHRRAFGGVPVVGEVAEAGGQTLSSARG